MAPSARRVAWRGTSHYCCCCSLPLCWLSVAGVTHCALLNKRARASDSMVRTVALVVLANAAGVLAVPRQLQDGVPEKCESDEVSRALRTTGTWLAPQAACQAWEGLLFYCIQTWVCLLCCLAGVPRLACTGKLRLLHPRGHRM